MISLIETRRLRLRPIGVPDADYLRQLWSEPSVIRGLGWSGAHTLEEARQAASNAERHWKKYAFGPFAILLKDAGERIGYVELEVFEGADIKKGELAVELGYVLHPLCRGKGYASEAACAAVRFGFETTQVPFIFAATGDSNLASQKVMLAAGLKPIPERPYYPHCPHWLIRRADFTSSEEPYACIN